MTEYDKMLAGEPHCGLDPEIRALAAARVAKKAALDAVAPDDVDDQLAAMRALFGSVAGPCVITPPFFVDFGTHVHLGKWVFVNAGATFLDSNTITIGDHAALGPNVQLITASHPKRPEDRILPKPGGVPPFDVINIAKPIVVGSYAWIGAGAIVMPGVTVGDGAIVGAGAVVTKDVPDRMIAVGNPARVIGAVSDP
ncbi:MAG: sugar O-acetyltransferase [Pseudomonadota bacterium]